ncbi:MAG: hypothetical protein FJW64_08925 [Actinobacteria bacterium]|nr:hypothetical protein [Actinomycetota bacterium]
MPTEDHVPPLTHLRNFTRARSKGRATLVAADRQQVEAPSENRVFAFAYQRFLTALLDYMDNGSRGSALDQAVLRASDRMRRRYDIAATGMKAILAAHPVRSARRQQRNTVVLDLDGYEMVSRRLQVEVSMRDGRQVYAFMHFPHGALTPLEVLLMDTAIALAVRQVNPAGIPAVIMVRTGILRYINVDDALHPDRVGFLRSESGAYRAEWAVAA